MEAHFHMVEWPKLMFETMIWYPPTQDKTDFMKFYLTPPIPSQDIPEKELKNHFITIFDETYGIIPSRRVGLLDGERCCPNCHGSTSICGKECTNPKCISLLMCNSFNVQGIYIYSSVI
jgi:hypothetical protein